MHALTHVYLFVDGPTFHQMALNTYYLASMLLATVSYKLTAEEAVKRTGVPHLCCSIPSGGRRRIRCSGPPHPNSCILSVRPARAAGDGDVSQTNTNLNTKTKATISWRKRETTREMAPWGDDSAD